DVHHLDVEVQVLARHRMVEVHVHHAHAHLLDGHRARAEVGVQHHLHAGGEALVAEVLLRHALGQARAALAVGFGGGHVHGEPVAGLAAFHRLLQARDDVAVAGEDRERLASVGGLHGLGALLGDRVVEADDAVFLDLHGSASILGMRAHYPLPAVALSLALLSAGCGGPGAVRDAPPPARHWATNAPADPAAANAVLMRAISLVGTPYRYGGNTPEGGFDCSGLVNYVFRDMLDLRLPRTSRELAAWQ